jgi:hypothetical protein
VIKTLVNVSGFQLTLDSQNAQRSEIYDQQPTFENVVEQKEG